LHNILRIVKKCVGEAYVSANVRY